MALAVKSKSPVQTYIGLMAFSEYPGREKDVLFVLVDSFIRD
jgi:hypothetical protein